MGLISEIEIDLQDIFNSLHSRGLILTNFNCAKSLKKSRNFYKGDYFLCLKGIDNFSQITEEVTTKLCQKSYISKSIIDQDRNLFLSLNRPYVYAKVLENVEKLHNKYGTMNLQEVYFILVHTNKVIDFNLLRITFISDFIISFLSSNGAKVFFNYYESYSTFSPNLFHSHKCCSDCTDKIKLLASKIKQCALLGKCNSETEDNFILINGQECISKSEWMSNYANVGNIKIFKDKQDPFIALSANIAHFNFICDTSSKKFIHIFLQNQEQQLIKSAFLLELFDMINSSQYFIACQNTLVSGVQVTVNSFIDAQKEEIKNAIIQKHAAHASQNEMSKYLVLNDTALKFCVLKAGVNLPLKINFPLNQSSQDGMFVQYNYARLLNLFKSFELKVEQGFYKPLPPLEEIDFQVLKLEEEWKLLNFILSFPRLVQETFTLITKPIFSVNKICIMLIHLCRIFSIYYSKIRILGGQKPHLQKVMHARLWLLKGVFQVIHNSFIMLNIHGLSKM